jgi:16S rRNA (guanine966-N2)-methyltransferase
VKHKKLINSFQIIAGDYRRKSFSFIGDNTLRPTPNRVRETLFNWLQFDIVGAAVLDCFAGSGALGFEALSRGAKNVVLIEQNPQTAKQLQHNIKALNNAHIQLINDDIFNLDLNQTFDVVFLDPPFNQELIPKTLDFLIQKKLIDNQTLIYLESEKQIINNNLEIIKQKQAASVFYSLVKVNEVLKR